MGDLSEHFSRAELCCPHCGQCELDPRLVPALEQLRAAAGRPVVIQSGYRCAEHNRAVGGQPDSRHVLGQAADWHIAGMTLQQMYDLASGVQSFGGLGAYDGNFIHADLRAGRARWARVNGKYLGIEALVSA